MLRVTKGQRVTVAGIFIAISFALTKLNFSPTVSNVFMIAAAVIAGYPIVVNAIRALKFRYLGIEALVTLAVTGAIIIGEYWEAAAVTFLFMFGSYLEAKTLEKTRSSLKALLDLAPDTAKVLRDNAEIVVSPEDVVKGEIVIVRPGEKIPVDGTISEGSAYVNQASITGESLPIAKDIGDAVYSGTIIESGYLKIKAEQTGEDTTFARILHLVEEAQDKKAKTQKFMEVFAKYYTPGIMVLATVIFLITKDIELALTLLVIACPGALVISTPVSIVAGIGNGAKHGVIIKGGEVIEKLAAIKVLAFDKTGTLTVGRPMVTKLKGFLVTEEELLYLAASAESYSEHPLAKAILEAGKGLEKPLITPQDSQFIIGQGLQVKLNDNIYYLGNRKLMTENKLTIPTEVADYLNFEEAAGQTTVIVADASSILGVISIADEIRKDALKLVQRLKRLGIKKTVMLTGDNKLVASSIAKSVGLDDYFAELLPQDKVAILKKLQTEGKTAMVGDGVNDAPALATADLGVAIGGIGSHVAMETADVVLMSAELKKLAYAINLSQATIKNMKQNIYFAIMVVGVLLVGVITKNVVLSSGMLIHELSVLLVILNALRLLRFNEK